ncbi:MAG: hypothetical protein GXY74_16060 [Phycisphaerae bacterium]|nr:hypothetical protein [Phycisphaerae bacterium]
MTFDQGERKKLKILGVLVAIGAIVVVVQLVRKKGPATAMAASPTAVLSTTPDLPALLQEMQAGLMPSTGGLQSPGAVFGCIDEALDVFAGGSKASPVPLESLRTDVFGVPRQFLAPPPAVVEEVKSAPPAQLQAAEEPKADPIAEEFATLRLMTCMVSQRNQAAIINGAVVHCGETVGSFVVKEIAPGQVVLTHDGKPYTLKLR